MDSAPAGGVAAACRSPRTALPSAPSAAARCSPQATDARVERLALAACATRCAASRSWSGYVPLTDGRARAACMETAATLPAGHQPVLPVADRSGAPVLPGADAGDPGAGRGAGPPRRAARIRSARTRPGPVRGHRPQVSGPGAASSRSIRCSVYCRHCTRRRITKGGEAELDQASSCSEGIEYIRAHPEVRDVLISGGDPFLLSDERLEELLAPLREIPHVEMIRIGTRDPGVPAHARRPTRWRALLRRYAPRLRGDALQPPQGDHPRGARGLRAAGGSRRAGGEPGGADAPAQLGRAHHQGAVARAACASACGPYYLHQMDVAEGLRAPAHAHRQGRGDPPAAARATPPGSPCRTSRWICPAAAGR